LHQSGKYQDGLPRRNALRDATTPFQPRLYYTWDGGEQPPVPLYFYPHSRSGIHREKNFFKQAGVASCGAKNSKKWPASSNPQQAGASDVEYVIICELAQVGEQMEILMKRYLGVAAAAF
jgi:hypothetical protein